MVLTAPRRWRLLAAVVAGVGALSLTALPAQAAPSTKYYSASVGDPVLASGSTTTLSLTNAPVSQQSFGSAQLTFSSDAVSIASVPSGWNLANTPAGSSTYLLTSSSVADSIAPGGSLQVTLAVSGSGSTSITTAVKQSNDFKGGNNSFINTGADPVLTVVPSGASICSPGTSCTTQQATTDSGITASATFSAQSTFGYQFGFATQSLLNPACTAAAFGSTATVEPLVVQTYGPAVGKTITITFPKALVNLEPNNGTPGLDVCAGADAGFPALQTFPAATGEYPFQGLLYDCDDPAYVKAVGKDKAGDLLHMCIVSRAKGAGATETVVINVDPSANDPMYW
ncbi:MAG: hypothetical protein ACTHQ3_01855 [Motilibacteraceae bacterium]